MFVPLKANEVINGYDVGNPLFIAVQSPPLLVDKNTPRPVPAKMSVPLATIQYTAVVCMPLLVNFQFLPSSAEIWTVPSATAKRLIPFIASEVICPTKPIFVQLAPLSMERKSLWDARTDSVRFGNAAMSNNW